MRFSKSDQETINQNKIAIAVFNITLFVALVALFESIDSTIFDVKILIYFIMGIPAIFYFLFLTFLALRYKQEYPYTFRFIEDFEISEVTVCKLYDMASSSFFLVIYGVLTFVLSKLSNLFGFHINIWLSILISVIVPFFLMKLVAKVLKLKYADYIEDYEYKKLFLRKRKK